MRTDIFDDVRVLVEDHEGLELFPYPDTKGKITIGYGRNLTDVGISEAEAAFMRDNDIEKVLRDLATFPWFDALDPTRAAAVSDFRFNVGVSTFRSFRRFLAAMQIGNYTTAARELEKSEWYTQVKRRGPALVEMIRDGVTKST